MNNKITNIFLLIPFVLICAWGMYYAHFVKNNADVILPIQGYDPRNLLSGHYIQFQINWDKADCFQLNWNGVCPKRDFAGIDRYYIPEDKAQQLERLINSDSDAEILFAYKKGMRPIAKDLKINGVSWSDYFKN